MSWAKIVVLSPHLIKVMRSKFLTKEFRGAIFKISGGANKNFKELGKLPREVSSK